MNQTALNPPTFSKDHVSQLIRWVLDSNSKFASVLHWRDIILYAVGDLRARYMTLDKSHPDRLYYDKAWQEIDKAGDDTKKLINALEYLYETIKWN